MRNKTIGCCLLLLSFALAGCGASPDSLYKAKFAGMNDLITALESSKDAQEAKPQIEAASETIWQAEDQLRVLLTPEKRKEYDAKYEAQLQEIGGRMGSAMAGMIQKDGANMKVINDALNSAALKRLNLKKN